MKAFVFALGVSDSAEDIQKVINVDFVDDVFSTLAKNKSVDKYGLRAEAFQQVFVSYEILVHVTRIFQKNGDRVTPYPMCWRTN